MEEKEREVVEMRDMLVERQDKMETLLKQMARVLAQNTQYATMISAPPPRPGRGPPGGALPGAAFPQRC